MEHDNSDSTTRTDSEISIEQVEALVDERVQEATADLHDQLEEEKEKRADLEEENEELRGRVEELEMRLDAAVKRIDSNIDRIGELQTRELEKGAHLTKQNVEPIREALSLSSGKIEFFEGDDGEEYARQPGEADPLERSGESVLATADLLPIQQLARMDDDMLASATSTRPDYIAARVWAERGQHSPGSVWSAGGPEVAEYLDASDVRTFIKANLEREDETLSYDYAKKLAGEAIERIRELAKDRVYIQRKNHRKDGLRYKERRLVLPSDAEIPGEGMTDAPVTDGVTG